MGLVSVIYNIFSCESSTWVLDPVSKEVDHIKSKCVKPVHLDAEIEQNSRNMEICDEVDV